MGFWKTILNIARRRFIGPPIIIVALGIAGFAFYLTPTHYVSSGYMVLTTPTGGGVVDTSKPAWQTNPLLQFNDGLKTTAAILIQSMNVPDVMAGLGAAPGSGTKITIDDGSSNPDLLGTSTTGPFIYVEVDGKSSAAVRNIVVNAEKMIRGDLDHRQTDLKAPRSTYVALSDVVAPTDPVAKTTRRWEAGGLALFASLFVLFGIAYVVELRRIGPRPHGDAVQRPGRIAIDPPDHYGYATAMQSYESYLKSAPAAKPSVSSGSASSRPASSRPVSGRPISRKEALPAPLPEEDEAEDTDQTREFKVVFDDAQEKSPTGEQRVHPRTVIHESSDDRQSGPDDKRDAGNHSDVAAPRVG
jgi:hypothetical protein